MEKPNVNNLNGVPNFGHGLPGDVPEQDVVAADPDAVEQVELSEDNIE